MSREDDGNRFSPRAHTVWPRLALSGGAQRTAPRSPARSSRGCTGHSGAPSRELPAYTDVHRNTIRELDASARAPSTGAPAATADRVCGRWSLAESGRWSLWSLLHITIEYQRFSYILSLVADGVWSRVALVAHRVWSPVADGVWSLVALVADRVWPLVAVRVWSLIECGRWSLAESGRRSLWSLMEWSLMESEDRVAVVAGRHGR
eukprot:COSAG06_NODE_2711_length_6401_cov_343.215192_2_plen_206_part_00